MALISLQHFLRRHGGLEAVNNLSEALNSPHRYHRDIAQSFGMDEGQFSRFVKEHFDVVYVLKDDSQQLIDQLQQVAKDHYESDRRTKIRILRLPQTLRDDTAKNRE